MFKNLHRIAALSIAVFSCPFVQAEDAPATAETAAPVIKAVQPSDGTTVRQSETSLPMLPQKLSLHDAKLLALNDNPDLKTTQARIRKAIARIKQNETDYMPTINFNFDAERRLNTPAYEKGDKRRSAYSIFQTGLNGTYTLYNGMTRHHNLVSAELEKQIEDLNHENAQRKLLLAVATAYFDAMLQRQNVIIYIDDYNFNLRLQDNAEKKLRHGTGTKSDVLNFEIQAKNAQGQRLLGELNYRTSLLALAELLGALPEQIPENMELDAVKDYTKAPVLKSYDELCEDAFQNRPDLEAAKLSIKSQEEQIKAQRGANRPTIQLYGSYGFDKYHNVDYRRENTEGTIGISLSWNLFDGGLVRYKVAQAVAARMEQEASRKSLAQSIQHEVAKHIQTINQARTLADLKNDTQILAKQARDLVQKEYDIGRVTATRLNEAQNDLTNAQGAYIMAVINYWQYRQDLDAATGAILNLK